MSDYFMFMPVIAMVVVGAYYLKGRGAAARYDQEYSNYRAGNLARFGCARERRPGAGFRSIR